MKKERERAEEEGTGNRIGVCWQKLVCLSVGRSVCLCMYVCCVALYALASQRTAAAAAERAAEGAAFSWVSWSWSTERREGRKEDRKKERRREGKGDV